MVPGRDIPSKKGRPSASIFQRFGLVGRRGQATPDTQPDYHQRWPTVTTLVEQRSESRLPPTDDDDQAPKSAKVKALEAAAVPVQWLQCRLESVQDRLEIKIDDAQAKGQRRPSTAPEAGGRTSPNPRKPGQSTHPYDTDVVPHPAADDGDSRATTVRQFETHIFADPPPEPRKTWRLRLASLTKTSKVARSDMARSSEEALVPGDYSDSPPTSPGRRCKCAKERRRTAYPGKPPSQPPRAAVGVPVVREPAEPLSASSAKSSPGSAGKRAKAKADKAESRTTPLSNAPRTPDPPTSRRPSLPIHTSPSGSQPQGRLSSAKADLLHMFASRPTSAGSDVGGVTTGRASLEHKAQLPLRTCSIAAACVCKGPSLGTGGAVPAKDGISSNLSGGTPKAGTLRHVLELIKMAPPSRAASPTDLATEGGSGSEARIGACECRDG